MEFVAGDRNILEDELGGDESFYPLDKAASFETNSENIIDEEEEIQQVEQSVNAKRRKKVNRFV